MSLKGGSCWRPAYSPGGPGHVVLRCLQVTATLVPLASDILTQEIQASHTFSLSSAVFPETETSRLSGNAAACSSNHPEHPRLEDEAGTMGTPGGASPAPSPIRLAFTKRPARPRGSLCSACLSPLSSSCVSASGPASVSHLHH